jgi:antitoxin component YwqK of YwqJK toxin-antitoxin module
VSCALRHCAIALALAPLAAGAQTFEVGACRGRVPHGAYELRTQDGRLRVAGAFTQGRRTGTFIFWNSSGARVAVIPYQDDDKAGTVALWYTAPGARRELRRKLEAPYVENRLQGIKRSWYPRGTRRAEFHYRHGVLIDATAWEDDGTPRSKPEAEAQAATDEVTDEQLFAVLETLIHDHSPHCD